MRVHISYTVDVDDDFRREINAFYGRDGIATREDIKNWFYMYGQSMNDDLSMQEAQRAEMARIREDWRDDTS